MPTRTQATVVEAFREGSTLLKRDKKRRKKSREKGEEPLCWSSTFGDLQDYRHRAWSAPTQPSRQPSPSTTTLTGKATTEGLPRNRAQSRQCLSSHHPARAGHFQSCHNIHGILLTSRNITHPRSTVVEARHRRKIFKKWLTGAT